MYPMISQTPDGARAQFSRSAYHPGRDFGPGLGRGSAPALEQVGHGRDAIDLGGATPGYLFASAARLLAVLILLLRRRDLG